MKLVAICAVACKEQQEINSFLGKFPIEMRCCSNIGLPGVTLSAAF